jgi:hypothetical protein
MGERHARNRRQPARRPRDDQQNGDGARRGDRDPLRDQGPFSEIAVTGRQWSAGQTLSDDNLAIDGRLDRIRLRVELALAPPPPPVSPTPAPRPEGGD